ncbi:fibrous sheath CABYR-binding protein-like [Alligator sinensis]|uniref:Fibrous sheath CABYR-binding protein-like n=1 Tax=Alligator sinensis TaxID=38654 RepID=A0A3Q0FVK5_ALLSI|nr:fibrous sheath CABYR-binding protein-like [Alligator sinensis]
MAAELEPAPAAGFPFPAPVTMEEQDPAGPEPGVGAEGAGKASPRSPAAPVVKQEPVEEPIQGWQVTVHVKLEDVALNVEGPGASPEPLSSGLEQPPPQPGHVAKEGVTVHVKLEDVALNVEGPGASPEPLSSGLEQPPPQPGHVAKEGAGWGETPRPQKELPCAPKEEPPPRQEPDSPDTEATWDSSADESSLDYFPRGGSLLGTGSPSLWAEATDLRPRATRPLSRTPGAIRMRRLRWRRRALRDSMQEEAFRAEWVRHREAQDFRAQVLRELRRFRRNQALALEEARAGRVALQQLVGEIQEKRQAGPGGRPPGQPPLARRGRQGAPVLRPPLPVPDLPATAAPEEEDLPRSAEQPGRQPRHPEEMAAELEPASAAGFPFPAPVQPVVKVEEQDPTDPEPWVGAERAGNAPCVVRASPRCPAAPVVKQEPVEEPILCWRVSVSVLGHGAEHGSGVGSLLRGLRGRGRFAPTCGSSASAGWSEEQMLEQVVLEQVLAVLQSWAWGRDVETCAEAVTLAEGLWLGLAEDRTPQMSVMLASMLLLISVCLGMFPPNPVSASSQ